MALFDRIRPILTVHGGKIIRKAIKLAPTQKIKGAIRLLPAKALDNGAKISIKVDLEKAPEAAAYEFGSGIHGKEKRTYKIRPKNVGYLAFFWDKVNPQSPTGRKFLGISKTTGKAIFTYVDHPGVEAKPYMQPAIREEIPLLTKELKDKITRELKLSVTYRFEADRVK